MLLPLSKNIDLINILIKQFYRGSLDFTIKTEDVQEMTWSKQEKFLSATVNNPLIKRYPVKREFSRLFLKKLIAFLEGVQEVNDGVYENLCKVMDSSQNDFCYRHYIIGEGIQNIVTVKETNNMVVNGTTGLRTWEAAIMLADWALCNIEIIKEKKILELGSGVGFTGIVIGKFCQPESILLTDCHEDVLKTIEENVSINFPMLKRHQMPESVLFKGTADVSLGIMNLDWNHIDDVPSELCPDIIIGSDIIYDPAIIKPLCNVIKALCDKNENIKIYIAGVLRNEETYNMFLERITSFFFFFRKY
ncbi:protein-lysine N-methyltransferase EEF2KMT isoform X2 [Ostrinia nubilalis]|uniref:protein-lysine N-methyltransferase EEF2KMT isoform X2 n=1 Tax=Ostrinia nubilalis TaxID=29057 RepID=UPI0030822646